jgi:hypothetical protein
MRHAARVDENQASVVAALRAAGARVWVIGLPVDLLIAAPNGKIALMELKDGAKSPSRRKKTALQADFFREWGDCPLFLVDGPGAALRHLGVLSSG